MNKNEFAKLTAMIRTNWPKLEFTNERMTMWYDCLNDLAFADCNMALKKIAMSSDFSPTIAAIRKAVADTNAPMITGTEAWEEVTNAMRKYGSWNPQEALTSFTEVTRRTVDAFGWDRLCGAENIDVVRGQFLKMYDSLSERKKHDRLLSPGLLALTQNTIKGIE